MHRPLPIPIRCACAAVSRVVAGIAFALAANLANADQELSSSFMTVDLHTYERYSAALNKLEAAHEVKLILAELDVVNLAQLSDQIKRQDAQTVDLIAIVYPDLGEPYRGVFNKIIEGIETQAKVVVRRYPIGPGQDTGDLNAQLKRNGIKVVIALGRQGLRIASGLDRDISLVAGAIVTMPEDQRNMTGISLSPDPALLFGRLKNLMPGVKRVIVVYDPQHNEALIRLAREAAKTQGLELAALEARDLASAARAYEAAFDTADSRRDSVWLPQDATTVEEGTILPLVLKASWNRSVPFFSSTFLHVKRGALFALYPNNVELGRNLANSALSMLAGESGKRGMSPLRDVSIAVNLRTANHIGLNIGDQQQRSFDLIYPER